jgi:fructose-1,6-bisphosphatase/inositol monophosphatase family enzyme
VIGEEFLELNHEGPEYTWTIDPIDGTRAFVHGVPFFGTMIGLYRNKEPVFGIIEYHALGETIFAVKGEGAYWQGPASEEYVKCSVSDTESFAEATLCTTGEE